jgi:hypothetical protein
MIRKLCMHPICLISYVYIEYLYHYIYLVICIDYSYGHHVVILYYMAVKQNSTRMYLFASANVCRLSREGFYSNMNIIFLQLTVVRYYYFCSGACEGVLARASIRGFINEVFNKYDDDDDITMTIYLSDCSIRWIIIIVINIILYILKASYLMSFFLLNNLTILLLIICIISHNSMLI